MLFNSFPFLLLVLATLIVYYNVYLKNYQVHILIISSFVFYAYGQPYLLLLLFLSSSINAIASYKVYYSQSKKKKKFYAILGVSFNISVLSFFKYSPLFGVIVNDLNSIGGIGEFLIAIPLPVGISFYTFQGISLVVDLYRSNHQSECPLFKVPKDFKKHYINTLFFISFFPQLVAGPIVKAYQFYPQIKTKYFFDVEFEDAFKLLTLGYFFKMVIADNLKDQTFWMAYPYFESFSSLTLITLLFGYSIQIFSDFAGYSLIAIGIAKLYGYNLPQNFNYPYISRSFSEFWTRWHISLSTWLKEYLYIPLGGNRVDKTRVYVNLFIVMLLGGLWHGAAWSYMVWGGYHGGLLIAERYFMQYTSFHTIQNRLLDGIRILFVFTLVTLGWLLFKLPEFWQAVLYVKSIIFSTGVHRKDVMMMIFFYSLPIVVYYANYLMRSEEKNYLDNSLIYAVMLFLIITNSGSSGEFIYFQF
ncbi:MAG: membrane-bound O-acyltransferase family protein [SAR324 cluster bacterium]|uniref:Membrane-bound O-acyltransferase family protein n=1 Tax=SAR324 cluster bacterium TaxID=2024889 RepID=A0A2A4T3R3_9DELT|nr:MAG: membrane-bound O-acyltransferase family protein [SAR324 cluster bacterium]